MIIFKKEYYVRVEYPFSRCVQNNAHKNTCLNKTKYEWNQIFVELFEKESSDLPKISPSVLLKLTLTSSITNVPKWDKLNQPTEVKE